MANEVKPAQRLEWIKAWLQANPREYEISILHQAFVDAYIEACKPRWKMMMYGSHKVPILSQDLSALAKAGFKRMKVDISGQAGEGWPKWVYSYPNPYSLTNR